MSNKGNKTTNQFTPQIYEIRIQGHFSAKWSDCFEGLEANLEDNGNTLLVGPVRDQAALYGILRKVRDLGSSLISVQPVQQ